MNIFLMPGFFGVGSIGMISVYLDLQYYYIFANNPWIIDSSSKYAKSARV